MVTIKQTEEFESQARPLNFQPIRSTRAFEEIAAQIRTELAEGRLRVGNRLPSERALSEQFGVSRNTLREALRPLSMLVWCDCKRCYRRSIHYRSQWGHDHNEHARHVPRRGNFSRKVDRGSDLA